MYEFPSEYLCSDLIVTDGFIGSQYKFSIIPFFFYMPDYAPYGQENSFWFPIPSSLKLSSYWRVFQAFSLSYTLASRQFKPYFASFILLSFLSIILLFFFRFFFLFLLFLYLFFYFPFPLSCHISDIGKIVTTIGSSCMNNHSI